MSVIFFLLWLLLNAHIGWDAAFLQIVLFGIALSAVLFFFMTKFTRWNLKFELFFLRNLPLFLAYGLVLFRDVVTSNFKVISLIVKRNESPEPIIVSFQIPIENEILRSLLANSITLTPGTITIACTEEHFTVHALRGDFIEGFEDSTLVKLLMKMEGRTK